jgi:pSer/pThr/pTyr-binding forkhead associated (FHA) protein
MEAILLSFRDEPLRVFQLDDRSLEVGSGAGCDIVVHDVGVEDRHVLLRREGLDVWAEPLHGEARRIAMTVGKCIPLGKHHRIERVLDAGPPRFSSVRTEPIIVAHDTESSLCLIVGRGADARHVTLGSRSITLGADRSVDVVLHDRAVSARHARIEPAAFGYVLRDLGSRNGTFVEGVRAMLARVVPGLRIRLGRTDLRIVSRGEAGDAREGGLVAASSSMIEVLGTVERLSRLPWPVLVLGESGVGKEGIARALHLRGPRRERPLVTVNAGGMSETLVESELFGHEKGAFTGASGMHRGVFEQAEGGTLFLDEIGELPLSLQARLLRVLETGEVRRVGGEASIRVDVRIVCATHRDLRAMVRVGTFREDLYYRLVQLVVQVPPLRERPEDVRALAAHFLARAGQATGARTFTEAALLRLCSHHWPGNVRELRNVVQSTAAYASGAIDVADVEDGIARIAGPMALSEIAPDGFELAMRRYGNVAAAARALGLPRSTLRDRLARTKQRR